MAGRDSQFPGPKSETWGTRLTCYPKLLLQPHQRRNGIARARAEAALHRQPLFDVDGYSSPEAEFLQNQKNHLPSRIATVGGDAAIV